MGIINVVASWAVPAFIVLILLSGIIKKVPFFEEFTAGAGEGLRSCISVIPSLVALLTAVSMLRASGALDFMTELIAPWAQQIGLPPEILPLALMRPVSGSGSLAVLEGIYSTYGTDSLAGLVASVLQSSTETTFYTIAVYYGSVHIKRTRHTLAAALTGDVCSVIFSALAVQILLTHI